MTLTIEALELFARNPQIQSIVRGLLAARKIAAKTKSDVTAMLAPVFARFAFVDTDDGAPITDPERLYMADLESPEMKAWDNARADAIEAAGYKVPTREHCPILIAEQAARELEWTLLAEIGKLDPKLQEIPYAKREEALTLFINLVRKPPVARC